LRGAKREELLAKPFEQPKARAQYLSDLHQEPPRKRGLRVEVQKQKREYRGLKKKLGECVEESNEIEEQNRLRCRMIKIR